MNLDLGFPLCFYDGMDEFAKYFLQFIFPVYLYILCGVIVLLSKCSIRMTELTSSKGIAVLNTLFYLSFGKLMRASLDGLLFRYAAYSSEDKDNSAIIWYFDGNLAYFEYPHVFLAIFALVFAICSICSYIIPLLFIKQCLAIRCCNARFKPMLDSYAAPYKDKYRFWFGLRIVVLVMLLMIVNVFKQFISLVLTLQIFLIGGLAFFEGFLKPYKNKLIGILDLTFLFNFSIICVLALYFEGIPHSSGYLNTVVLVFVALASLTFCCILVYHILQTLYNNSAMLRKYIEKNKEVIKDKLARRKRKQQEHEENTVNIELKPEVTHTEVGVRTRKLDEFVHSTEQSFSELRAPLMELGLH